MSFPSLLWQKLLLLSFTVLKGKPPQKCSSLLLLWRKLLHLYSTKEFPSRYVWCFFTILQQKKKIFTQNSKAGILRKSDYLCQCGKGQLPNNWIRHENYTELLRSFSREKIFRWELDRFQSPNLNKLRDWLDFMLRLWLILCTGIGWFSCLGIGRLHA